MSKRRGAADAGTTDLITLGADHRGLHLKLHVQGRQIPKKRTSRKRIQVGWKPDEAGNFSIATDSAAAKLRNDDDVS